MEIGLTKGILSFLGFVSLNLFSAASEHLSGKNKEKTVLNSLENAERFLTGTWTGERQTEGGGTDRYKYIFNLNGTFERYFAAGGASDWGECELMGKWKIGIDINAGSGEKFFFAVLECLTGDASNFVIKAILDNHFEENLILTDAFWRFTFILRKKDLLPFN